MSDSCPNLTASFRVDFRLRKEKKKIKTKQTMNNMRSVSYGHLTALFRAKLPAQYSHIRSFDFQLWILVTFQFKMEREKTFATPLYMCHLGISAIHSYITFSLKGKIHFSCICIFIKTQTKKYPRLFCTDVYLLKKKKKVTILI